MKRSRPRLFRDRLCVMNKKGLRSHAIPCIIAASYLIDLIGEPVSLLRGATLALIVIYLSGIVLSWLNLRGSDEPGKPVVKSSVGSQSKNDGASL